MYLHRHRADYPWANGYLSNTGQAGLDESMYSNNYLTFLCVQKPPLMKIAIKAKYTYCCHILHLI